MERLVYRPKAYAYINTINDGIIDISEDIVRGEVDRRVNQISTAEITIRNDRFKYTPKGGDPIFRPMDGITVYLSRIPAFPVQVFTGYLDSTPYYQLYPGTVTLQASCTLKKLEYTFWDPALPYMVQFMSQYGWTADNASGQLYNQAALDILKRQDTKAKGTKKDLNDGSIGSLLFATLNRIGGWDPQTIWIESLPDKLFEAVANLYKTIDKDIIFDKQVLTSFLGKIVGAAAQGQGNPGPSGTAAGTGATTDLSKAIPAMIQSSNANGINPLFVLATSYNECGFQASEVNTYNPSDCTGWFQFNFFGTENSSNPQSSPYPGFGPYTPEQARDPGFSSNVYCQACNAGVHGAGKVPSDQSQWASYAAQIQVAGSYPGWDGNMPTVQNYYNQYKDVKLGGTSLPTFDGQFIQQGGPKTKGTITQNKAQNSTTGSTSGTTTNSSVDVQQAASVAQQCLQRQQQQHCFHYSQQRPIQFGILTDATVNIDCSGFVIACYKAGGLADPSGNNYSGDGFTGDMITHCNKLSGQDQAVPGDMCFFGGSESSTEHVNLYVGNGQSISMGAEGDPSIGPSASMGPSGFLGFYRSNASGNVAGSGGTTGVGNAAAAAFGTLFNFPTLSDVIEAVLLRGDRSLMNDQPLFTFIQDLAAGSLRSFQSMPNGNFFGFFPDWFGTFSHRTPYWAIDDIEILDGSLQLSDESLVTHMYVVGDTITPDGNIDIFEKVSTKGVVTVYNAGVSGWMNFGPPGTTPTQTTGPEKKSVVLTNAKGTNTGAGGLATSFLGDKSAVLQFLARYGARPLYDAEPAIRSTDFEAIAAWQKFMQAWSQTFTSTFTFTFMPEVYPGGLVSFPTHGLQMYVESVLHTFDYEQGFTTQANLSSPAALKDSDSSFSRGLIIGDLSSKGPSSGVG